MSDNPVLVNNTHALLKASDVAKRLNISVSLAYHLIQMGDIPSVRIRNKIVRVFEPDLEQYIFNSRTTNQV